MVDQVRIGDHGFALVVAPDGMLVAHGDPDKKALVAQSLNMAGHHPLVALGKAGSGPNGKISDRPLSDPVAEYMDDSGREQLAVATRIKDLNWTVIVEQPTKEAYAGAMALRRQLIVAITVALFVMVAVGLLFGRRFIAPIFKLQQATQSVAEGNLETRVEIGTEDEFGKLGDAFNTMANRLVELQENVKRQERQAMFGRVVGGLFHDLMHPIQNIGNNARLMIRPDLDDESRQTTHRVIERELNVLKRFMDDVLNIAKPKPIQRFPMDVNSSVSEIVDAMRGQGESAGVAVEGHFATGPLIIEGDRFSLGRVYRNLIKNAIQATAAGGRVVVTHRARRRSGRDPRRRYRVRHSAGSSLEDLRRFRDHQEPRPRPRPGDFKADRRAVGRHDCGSERGWARHVVHLALPGERRPLDAGCRKLTRFSERMDDGPDTGQDRDVRSGERRVSGALFRTEHTAGPAALQRRDSARARRPNHPRR